MHLQPEIRDYGADAKLRHSHADLVKGHAAAWRRHHALRRWQPLLLEMTKIAKTGDVLRAARYGSSIVEDKGLAGAFISHWLAVLRAHPMAVPNLAVNRSGNGVSAVLYQNLQTTLSLVSLYPDADADTISFSKGATVFAPIYPVSAQIQCWHEEKAQCTSRYAVHNGAPIQLSAAAVCIDTDSEAMQFLGADQPGLLLRLTVAPPDRRGQLQRHYATQDGRLVRLTTADARETRQMLLLAALRAMGAAHALPQMLKACDQPLAALRWQAMRECLSTDMPGALAQLETMASKDEDAQIRTMAAALMRQIAEKKVA
ncbi:hypothetical protein [Alterisphingorhabdus coralli]|uniref:HEAT repeat domain-containing protein n=1 Tax=Alterisphingorhabdus coralli TaxID=3071408 RepID=A0AA97F9W2_9SPHN|nr:hypothetical protein [Parasphingorhabdus sp. SCSIO 66989]WOE76221.1 hypothetical protein RB602_05785 [Parasphingorhabdus sp. SCSIO 66989]